MTAWTEGDVQVNDITSHYSRTGDKSKSSILLLHGITDSGRCWSRMAADLADSYDVIMTDARGHGRSGISTEEVSISVLADDAAAVVRALELQKPFLIGHSMGAVTAAAVAANYPDLVRAIVLEDPPLFDKPPSQTDINRGLMGTTEEQSTPLGWQWLFDLRTLPREERIARGRVLNPTWAKEEIGPWADSKGEMNIAILEPALAAVDTFRWREIMARIQCPILLITGDPKLGAIVTPETARQAASLWKQGEAIHIAGAGHNIHRDRYDETMRAVTAFLNQV
ncbi:alpha/beta hydrolase [Reticulibacter mediterranei]|uniref:Alpha/beta hydrolase n=1 Tax=Reticulibacter mediterranei TaxID=2778369 RepID=A0A8J3N5H8_9CHLR|nr:alpha/beta hydrolase [Reticulibacter mediterranei]GHO96400.1 alpha/beta hydrolase [Reticulibacter mediterranei]